MDVAAAVLGEILLSPSRISGVYHLENPMRQPWHDMIELIADYIGISGSRRLEFDEWFPQVRDFVEARGTEDDRMVAEMLSDFFEQDFTRMATGKIILDTQRTRLVSKTLRQIDEVSPHAARKYIMEWRRSGFLSAKPAGSTSS